MFFFYVYEKSVLIKSTHKMDEELDKTYLFGYFNM